MYSQVGVSVDHFKVDLNISFVFTKFVLFSFWILIVWFFVYEILLWNLKQSLFLISILWRNAGNMNRMTTASQCFVIVYMRNWLLGHNWKIWNLKVVFFCSYSLCDWNIEYIILSRSRLIHLQCKKGCNCKSFFPSADIWLKLALLQTTFHLIRTATFVLPICIQLFFTWHYSYYVIIFYTLNTPNVCEILFHFALQYIATPCEFL